MKKLALIIIPVIILTIIVGFMVAKKLTAPAKVETPIEQVFAPAEPETKAKAEVTSSQNGRAVTLKITNLTPEVSSVEYEMSYLTNKGLSRGVIGKIRPNGQDSVTREILLGSCSTGGKCVYDEGVTKITLTLKFNKTSGPATGLNKDFEL